MKRMPTPPRRGDASDEPSTYTLRSRSSRYSTSLLSREVRRRGSQQVTRSVQWLPAMPASSLGGPERWAHPYSRKDGMNRASSGSGEIVSRNGVLPNAKEALMAVVAGFDV